MTPSRVVYHFDCAQCGATCRETFTLSIGDVLPRASPPSEGWTYLNGYWYCPAHVVSVQDLPA